MLLDGKNAIITGGGNGVGQVAALRFCVEGANVVVVDLDGAKAQATVDLISAAGGTAIAVQADVSNEDDVAAFVARCVERFGRLDIIFNNVGIPTPRLGMTFEEHTFDQYRRLVDVNFGGVFLGSKHAVIQFKKQGDGGVILNTGSVAGLVGWGGTVYGATKGAVHQLTKAVAIECAPFNIRANAICPGAMPFTGFMAAGGLAAQGEGLLQVASAAGSGHPLGRPITAEDCAEAAVFLCSDRAMNITGVLVPIDGGHVAR